MPDTTPNDLADSGPQPPSEESGASPTSFTAEKAITALQKYINADPDGLKIMAAFGKDEGDIPAGSFLWIGNLHSEAVAAAVFAFLQLVVDKEKEKDLYELIKEGFLMYSSYVHWADFYSCLIGERSPFPGYVVLSVGNSCRS